MKKIFSIMLVLVISATANYAGAQDNSIAFTSPDLKSISQYDNATSNAIDAATVSMRALRDFARSFRTITNERWYKVSDGFMASFNDKGVETKAAYDKKGVLHCIVRTLSEGQLPTEIRGIVKSKFYDFKILVAYEITHDEVPVYIFKIEDDKTLKMLRVADGELEVINDNTKE